MLPGVEERFRHRRKGVERPVQFGDATIQVMLLRIAPAPEQIGEEQGKDVQQLVSQLSRHLI